MNNRVQAQRTVLRKAPRAVKETTLRFIIPDEDISSDNIYQAFIEKPEHAQWLAE